MGRLSTNMRGVKPVEFGPFIKDDEISLTP
jgi:hypothetical protein